MSKLFTVVSYQNEPWVAFQEIAAVASRARGTVYSIAMRRWPKDMIKAALDPKLGTRATYYIRERYADELVNLAIHARRKHRPPRPAQIDWTKDPQFTPDAGLRNFCSVLKRHLVALRVSELTWDGQNIEAVATTTATIRA